MNILVCLKQILDPEVPARDFRVDAARREAEQGSANLVTNIFCENALETALQLRERAGGAKITVLSYGRPTAEDSLRKALAMKADAAALVLNESEGAPDPLAVARVLAAAVRKLGDVRPHHDGARGRRLGRGSDGRAAGGGVGAALRLVRGYDRVGGRRPASEAADGHGLGGLRGRRRPSSSPSRTTSTTSRASRRCAT